MSWHYIIQSKIIVKMMIKAAIDLEIIYKFFIFMNLLILNTRNLYMSEKKN